MAGKANHLVHTAGSWWTEPGFQSQKPYLNDIGRLLYYEPLPDSVRSLSTGRSIWHSHPGVGGWYSQINAVHVRESGQTLYIHAPGTVWPQIASCILLRSDGYWYQYHYVGPNATISKLKRAVELPSNVWQTSFPGGGYVTSRIYATGGLPVNWGHVVVRSRSQSLFGFYYITGAIAYHENSGFSSAYVTPCWNYTQRIT